MSTKKAVAPLRITRTARPKAAAPAKSAKAVSKNAAKAQPGAELKRQIDGAIGKVRETSRENMLLGLGALSKLRQQREDRMAELIAEGKRMEPKVKKALDDMKAKLQPKGGAKFDLGKFKMDKLDLGRFKLDRFKFDAKAFDRQAMRAKFEERMAESLHKIGLPTRKEVEALSRKVDKLAALQQA